MTPDLAAVCERMAQEAVALESEAKRVKDAFPLTGRSLDRRAADLRAALAAIWELAAQRDRARADAIEEAAKECERLRLRIKSGTWFAERIRSMRALASAPAAEAGMDKRFLAYTAFHGWIVVETAPRGWDGYWTVPGKWGIRPEQILARAPLPADAAREEGADNG